MSELKRCVYLPAQVKDHDVETFRKAYDFLYLKCPPHITVVFPFSGFFPSEEIAEIMKQVCNERPAFQMIVGPPRFVNDNVLMSEPIGNPWVCEAHRTLTNIIGKNPLPNFTPHMTIGREIENHAILNPDLENKIIEIWIDKMILEEIKLDGTSDVLYQIDLK